MLLRILIFKAELLISSSAAPTANALRWPIWISYADGIIKEAADKRWARYKGEIKPRLRWARLEFR